MGTREAAALGEGGGPARQEDGSSEYGRTATWTLALAVLVLFAVFRADALLRVRGVFLADSAEYLLMTRYLLTGEGDLSWVRDLRSCFFPLLLAAPLFAADLMGAGGDGFDPAPARGVVLAFHALALLGAWRLGSLLAGPRAGFLAAGFTAVVAELGYWSTDFLTDVPAAACIVWAAVARLRGRPAAAGVWLGVAVLLRYQSLIALAAFLAGPLLRRRWRELGRLLLGLVPPLLLLGLLDALYWGRPFVTLYNFTLKQVITFLPLEWAMKLRPDKPAGYDAPLGYAPRGRGYYLENLAAVLTWPLLAGLALYPLVRHRLRDRRGADLAVWVSVLTLGVLSLQRYKETRYLVAVIPLAAAVSAASVGALAGALARRLVPGRVAPAAALALPAALLAGAALYSWERQRSLPHRPYASVIEAVYAVPMEGEQPTVGLEHPWMVEGVPAPGLYRRLNISVLLGELARAASEEEALAIERRVYATGHFVLPHMDLDSYARAWDWINENTVLEGFHYEGPENNPPDKLGAVMRFRRSEAEDRERPFYELADPISARRQRLVLFESGVEFIGVAARAMRPSERAVCLQFHWRLPAPLPPPVRATFCLGHGEEQLEVFDGFQLVPAGEPERERWLGAALRVHRYVVLPEDLRREELRLYLKLTSPATPEGGFLPVAESRLTQTAHGWLELELDVQPPPE